jgi:hypothetical protein
VGRVRAISSRLAWASSLVTFAVVAQGCTQTLDAGRNVRDASICGDGGPGCTPTGLLDNLIGYWRLDDGAGSTIAFDSSGRGNHGALHNLDTATAWVAGRSQGALDLAHTGWVQVAPSPSIDSISDHITVTAWINLESAITSADGWATALSRQTGTSIDQHYHLSLDLDRKPSLFLITDAGYALIKGDPMPMGTWIHLAGVYDGTVARLYVNGTEVVNKPLTGAFAPDTTPIILGGNGNDASGVPTELVPGRLDELMLYARALSATEVSELAAGALFPGGARDASAD